MENSERRIELDEASHAKNILDIDDKNDIKNAVVSGLKDGINYKLANMKIFNKISVYTELLGHVFIGITTLMSFAASFFNTITVLTFAAGCCSTVSLILLEFSEYAATKRVKRYEKEIKQQLKELGISAIPLHAANDVTDGIDNKRSVTSNDLKTDNVQKTIETERKQTPLRPLSSENDNC